MLANPLKGEVRVEASGQTLTFVLTFGAQKSIAAHLGYKRFRDVLADMEELSDEQLGHIFWAGFQHCQPALTPADADAIVDQLGVNAMVEIIAEGVRLAFDAPPLEPAGAAAPGPRKARRSTPTPTTSAAASSSGSASD